MKTATTTDWLGLWAQRVAAREARRHRDSTAAHGDRWRHRAADFARSAPARASARHRVMALFDALLVAMPAASVLDIGAGTGVWSSFFAQRGCPVTAIEPSPSMRAELERSCAMFLDGQITVVPDCWPEVHVPPHEIVLCAHAMYGAPDFAEWIHAMTDHARAVCMVILRAPEPDDLFVEAARIVGDHGAPPMPDAYLAIHAMRQMGLRPHVIMEAHGAERNEVYPDETSILRRLKQDLHLSENQCDYDAELLRCIARAVRRVSGGLLLPPRPHNAILLWPPNHASRDVLDRIISTLECE